jgi:E3 ubiquitin-protein ligase HECTD2
MKDGENMMVNNANRSEFVDKYVDFVMNTSIKRQFGAFKRGFYHVCGGNALSVSTNIFFCLVTVISLLMK